MDEVEAAFNLIRTCSAAATLGQGITFASERLALLLLLHRRKQLQRLSARPLLLVRQQALEALACRAVLASGRVSKPLQPEVQPQLLLLAHQPPPLHWHLLQQKHRLHPSFACHRLQSR